MSDPFTCLAPTGVTAMGGIDAPITWTSQPPTPPYESFGRIQPGGRITHPAAGPSPFPSPTIESMSAVMDQTERQIIDDLFAKLRQAEAQSGPRDAQAESYIRDQVARLPAAPYLMAQSIVMLEQALAATQQRNQELEQQQRQQAAAPASGGGLFGGLFGGGGSSGGGFGGGGGSSW